MIIDHKKNTAFELAFPMLGATTPATFKAGLTVTATAYYKDGDGGWTLLTIADSVTEIADTGIYELSLVAGELDHDWVAIKFTAAGAADSLVSLSMHARDIDSVTTVTLGAIQVSTTGGVRTSSPITLEQFATATQTFLLTIKDADGAVVDLGGKTLRFVVIDSNDPPLGQFVINAGADLSISGASNEVVSVKIDGSDVPSATTEWHWRLWNVSDDTVLAHGRLIILPAIGDIP